MKHITACTMDCPDSCSLIVTRKPDGSVSIRGNPDHPFTAGFTCGKIRRHVERLRSPDRILHPLIKDGGGWRRISWEEALDICAEKIGELRDDPAAILHIRGSGAKGILKESANLFFSKLGASRTRGSLCDGAGFDAHMADFGSRRHNDPEDLMNAGSIVNWGKDLDASSIHLAALVKKARRNGARVLSITPLGADASADRVIRIRPGADRFLAAAVIRRFLESGGISDCIVDHIRSWNAFAALIQGVDEKEVGRICDVTASDIQTVFDFYASPSPAATLAGTGIQRYEHGGENIRFINALALISGNMGRSGGGCCYHLNSLEPFRLDWTEPNKSRRSLLEPRIGREIREADDPPVRMIWVNGCNIVNQAPDSHEINRAFESVPFIVVADAFMTDTAIRADLILPSALMMEQEDILGSFLHHHILHAEAVFDPPGEARTDDAVLRDLGGRLTPPVRLPEPETFWKRALDSPLLNTSMEELRRNGTARTLLPEIAYPDLNFDHGDGRARVPAALHRPSEPPEGYPLRLLSLIRREAIHSQIPESRQNDPPPVWISPDCGELKNLDLNRSVRLATPLGGMPVSVNLLENLHPEVAVYRRGDWMRLGGGVNRIIAAGITDMGEGAAYYEQYARLENA